MKFGKQEGRAAEYVPKRVIGPGSLLDDETVDSVAAWFAAFGETDELYLRENYRRFLETRDFALSVVPETSKLTILDIGAHWLHNAFFYANHGHRLICMDAASTFGIDGVKSAARAMNASLIQIGRLEKAEGFENLSDDTIDLVLFCEIIEHICFNPIPLWKHVYRVLKPSGRIIVTTPNAFYFRPLTDRLQRLLRGESYGLTVSDIFSFGTYGHHWKEFTLSELQAYFRYLSNDFDTSRFEMFVSKGEESIALGALEAAIGANTDVRAHQICLDVLLKRKQFGISVDPPWDVGSSRVDLQACKLEYSIVSPK